MKIDDSVALVTGGAGCLGRSIAETLYGKNAKVISADICHEHTNNSLDCYDKYIFDVTDPNDTKQTICKIIDKYGKIDILVNCAGRIVSTPFVNIMSPDSMMLPYEQFREEVTLNLDSVFIVTSSVIEQMILRRTKGCIINISSISARGNEGQTSYSAAKAAVEAMTITWSKELGRMGIRCNAIAPGFVGTESTYRALNDSHIKHIISSTPLHRLGTPEEISSAIVFLIENDFINGEILNINGGLTF